MKYVIGIDQSTQGTKAILVDKTGAIVKRADVSHKQYINDQGHVSHDLNEIYKNTIQVVKEVITQSGLSKKDIVTVGISNQRETTAAWSPEGNPLGMAVVWQCGRAKEIVKRVMSQKDTIQEKTGLPLSPYFPAAKMTWLLEHVITDKEFYLGTIDSWLLYKLTNGASFKTDYSNASRTQLFNLHTLTWDDDLCHLFGIPKKALPEVCASDSCFGYTDFDGYLEEKIPIHSVLGDSHSALFAQGCHEIGMAKATYGTGSSIMMNIGNSYKNSSSGLSTSLAWGMDGTVTYVLEGNINYTGAVISWLKQDLELIDSLDEIEPAIQQANKNDTTILVPAFTGLASPYWKEDAKALFYGMTRTTGKKEIIKAATESIGYQITDVLTAMEHDSNIPLTELRVDGGPTKNHYLMQFQSDIANKKIQVSKVAELSAIGVAYLAGIQENLMDKDKLFAKKNTMTYLPSMEEKKRIKKYGHWKHAVNLSFYVP